MENGLFGAKMRPNCKIIPHSFIFSFFHFFIFSFFPTFAPKFSTSHLFG